MDVEKLKAFWKKEMENPDNRKANVALARSVALFVGSVLFMRNLGDLMAI